MEENNIFRHNWDKFFKDGKTVILPIDHGTVIPVPELNNTGDLIEAVSSFVDGFVVNFGTARAFSDQLDGKGICFRTDVYKPSYQDNPDHGSYRAFTGDDALSVLSEITFLTSLFIADNIKFCVPIIFVLIYSIGLYSAETTCFNAAAWIIISTSFKA